MIFLSRLLMGCCYLLCLSGVSLATDVNNPSDENATSSQSNKLSTEEMKYILQECEGFATEDKITPEKRAAYIETCMGELSAAVENAIEQLQINSESTSVEYSDNATSEK